MNPDPASLRDRFRSDLLDDVIPFWIRSSVDSEYGGYLFSVDRAGKIIDTDKAVWLQGRFAWMLATLYLTVEPREEWLRLSRQGVEFLLRHGFDTDGRMFFQLARDGTPLRKRRYFFSETFAIIAFAAYARAAGDAELANRARSLFDTVLGYHKDPSLLPAKTTGNRPSKGLAVPMILIATAQVLRDTIGYPEINTVIDKFIAEIETDFLNERHEVLLETVGMNGEILDHFDGRLLNPGHAIEAAWFVLHEAKCRGGDERLIRLGTRILDWMWTRGWDQEYGGLYYYRDLSDLPIQEYWHDMKFWWPHNEAVIATLLAWKLTRAPAHKEKFIKVYEWTHSHFPDPQYGEWFGYLHRDGRISSELKGNMWKGAFHVPRMQWYCFKLLDEEDDLLSAKETATVTLSVSSRPPTETVVWKTRENGHAWHFVYGLTTSNSGTVLAFSEARLGPRDEAPHHLVLKRSTDFGTTWSDNIFIEYADSRFWAEQGELNRLECWANGAPVVDRETGRIFHFYALDEGAPHGENLRRFTRNFYRYSDDDGLTWSERFEVTDLLNIRADGSSYKDEEGAWILNRYGFPSDSLGRAMHIPGPGHGLCLRSGRLLMPFWNRTALASEAGMVPENERAYGLSLLYSDDHGKTWNSGPLFGEELGCNESRMVELNDGRLYVNARTRAGSPALRGILYGQGGGLDWQVGHFDRSMPPFAGTDAGLIAVQRNGKDVLLLSHPRHPDRRRELTISASLDGGNSWAVHKTLRNEGASYSDLVELSDGTIGVLYGKGDAFGFDLPGSPMHEGFDVCFLRFRLGWLGAISEGPEEHSISGRL